MMKTFFFTLMMSATLLNGADYYLSDSGDDRAAGVSPDAPWQTLKKINSTALQPGDKVLFKRGERWIGQLRLQGSGTQANPIIIDAYNEGPMPVIDAGKLPGAVVYFKDQDNFTLRNLAVTGNPERLTEHRQGILIEGVDAEKILENITVEHCNISNLYGKIGGYRTGGIIVAAPYPKWLGSPQASTKLTMHNINISNNHVERIGGIGIFFIAGNASPKKLLGKLNAGARIELTPEGNHFQVVFDVRENFAQQLVSELLIYNENGEIKRQLPLNFGTPPCLWKKGENYRSDWINNPDLSAKKLFIAVTLSDPKEPFCEWVNYNRYKLNAPHGLLPGAYEVAAMVDGKIIKQETQPSDDNSLPEDVVWSGVPCRGLTIGDNVIDHVDADGIIVMGVEAARISGNAVRNAGEYYGSPELKAIQYNASVAGLWISHSIKSMIEHNHVSNTSRLTYNWDGMSFDFDYSSYDNIMQYNVSENNAGGFVLFMPSAQRNLVRYNISKNDVRIAFVQSLLSEGNIIYNNVFFNDTGKCELHIKKYNPEQNNRSGFDRHDKKMGAKFYNNIFYATGNGSFSILYDAFLYPRKNRFEGELNCSEPATMFFNNVFWKTRNNMPDADNSLLIDPQFSAISGEKTFLLKNSSLCLDRGYVGLPQPEKDFYDGRINPNNIAIGIDQKGGNFKR